VRSSDFVVVVARSESEKTEGPNAEAFTNVSRAPTVVYGRGPAVSPGAVRYNDDRESPRIERPGLSVSITSAGTGTNHLRTEWTVYEWRLWLGEISIKEGTARCPRPWDLSGVRLFRSRNPNRGLERELAYGLALRVWRWTKIFGGDNPLHSSFKEQDNDILRRVFAHVKDFMRCQFT